MKKITLLFAASSLLFTFHTNAQSQRLVMFEEFTQASCPPCASTNPGLNAMLDANPTKVVSVKYQTSWPGADPMNAQNPTQVSTRVSYYSVTGVPDGQLDGGQGFSGQPAGMTQAMVNTRYAVTAPFTINVSHYLTHGPDVIHAHALLTCTGAVTGTLVAHMAVIERNVYFATAPGSNGEKEFEGVMKQMLPSASGTALATSWVVGDNQSIDLSWNLANVYDTNQLAVVVWIQDNANKHVLQAGYSAPHIPNDAGITAVAGLGGVSCNTTVTPTVTLSNFAAAPLTSCTISYSVDAGAPVDYLWSGNLAQGTTTTQALAPITVAAGSHSVVFSTSLPNGNPDLNSHNDQLTKTFNILGTVVASPLTQTFASAVFPPTNYNIENVAGDAYTWARSNAGFNGAGSAKADFYYGTGGNVDNFYTPLVDYTNAISGSELSFDVSHAAYSATPEADRLKVNVSTNCGVTWTNIYDKQAAALVTSTFTTSVFTPTLASQWRHETISMNNFIGQADILVQFQSISGYGNNLYVDNINITDGPNAIVTLSSDKNISIYPNPSQGEVNLSLNLDKTQDVSVTVTNTLGAIVSTLNLKDVTNGVYPLNLIGQAKGNYMVTIKTNDSVVNKRISITQ